MEKTLAIQHIYPSLEFYTDFEVTDIGDGNGPVIKWLNEEIPQPTQEELETAWVEIEKEIKAQKEKEQKALLIQQQLGVEDKVEALVKQITPIAEILAEIILAIPEKDRTERQIEGLIMFGAIKEILQS